MKAFLLLSLLCGVFISSASANYFCLGFPDSLKRGESCVGSNAPCEWGYYCDDEGICSPALEPGATCLYDNDCREDSRCQGKGGEKVCVQVAGVGDACQSGFDLTSLTPQCASPYQCHGAYSVCTYGRQKDKCRHHDSINVCWDYLECVNSACLPRVVGQECDSHTDCESTAFCDEDTYTCRARKESGYCDDEQYCAPGYSCVYSSDDDNSPQCVKHQSLKAGDYCGNSNLVCESFRCTSDRCAAGTSLFENSDCSEREVETCNGLIFSQGSVHQCTPNPCYDLEKNFGNCIQEHCTSCSNPRCTDYIPNGTPGQCYLIYCEQEFLAMRECNSAARLSGFTLFAVFLGLISSLLSKKL